MRLAFAGFRHGHVMGFYSAAVKDPRVSVVASCEEDADTRESLRAGGVVEITDESFEKMLARGDFDAVAVGDVFARRGGLIIRALEAGKHVISDKPICTDLAELTRIRDLSAAKGLRIGCLLDLRDSGAFLAARKIIKDGGIGEVHTVIFTAQHPLNYANRPAWYFEPGEHGGTINDIGVHAIDLIPWLTGRALTEVTAARAWNARLKQHEHFQDAAQMLLKLDNDGSVFGDVSYLSPDGLAYSAPQYWRVTIHGDGGVIETKLGSATVSVARASDKTVQSVPAESDVHAGCLSAFLAEVNGTVIEGGLTTADVLDASMKSLMIQKAADEGRCNVKLVGS